LSVYRLEFTTAIVSVLTYFSTVAEQLQNLISLVYGSLGKPFLANNWRFTVCNYWFVLSASSIKAL